MSNTPSPLSRSGCWASLPRSSIVHAHSHSRALAGAWSGSPPCAWRKLACPASAKHTAISVKRSARKRKQTHMNLNLWQILVLALLQGVTELFPISSLGHTVILAGLLGWGELVLNHQFLPLIVALHLGARLALA